jgi:carbon storage regulator
MLVISRKKSEGILIKSKEGDVRIVLIDIERGRVRLGIEAPRGYSIVREELLLEIEGANRMSAVKTLDKIRAFIGESSE